MVRALHRHRKGVGSIPAGEPIVDEFFSTVPGWFFAMCIIQLEPKTHYPSEFRFKTVSKEISRTEPEYMNINRPPPPHPPINVLALALGTTKMTTTGLRSFC